ncbi:MAG: hypothetical protein PHD82_14885 [Candidatus Riflebacteria bacterium]|nr:hypothetical protein [Candidatus Riflebacteria bacterium]
MNAPAGLPENIRADIGIYLAPEEKILKALTPFAPGAPGQVWLVLTSHSVVFHTCETGKEPLVALLQRSDIKEIEYFQKQSGVQLTFIPSRNTQKVSRLNFGPEKQEELEDFCEELADLINFKKETPSGIKIYSPPAANKSAATPAPPRKQQDQAKSKPPVTASTPAQASQNRKPAATIEEPELRHASSAIRHADKQQAPASSETVTVSKPEAHGKDDSEPAKPSPGLSPDLAEVKIVRPASSIGNSVVSGIGSSSSAATKSANSSSAAVTSKGEEHLARYAIVATLISLLVAFLWYRFFMMVSGWKDLGQRGRS